ncbi:MULTISPECIES: AraC family transcriptional regulator [Cellulophaga]|jgi:AraC-like DNA-binding protein|uniref:AraC family transcriptional regulator n=1 Tax=Cellulophaga baltica 18 TaxID=1348584 RepID=A0AAU8RBZ3_9FLAO|nr:MULTISPECIES: AraC family transcriptional regulator [Cellulophaga]AIZ41246.1 AraC family transcriptional regulator [Cellulophaga baltica 18]KGK32123.1 AraC family transcriptional regulator [Cellulophaga sp. E6(2014)]MCR1023437.1 helix-turn-helix transcriptional regulator [Cellulophaga baltica]WFO14778.1 helix-turn-helix transcriptional regulator [Cellulophaga baltica 4]
MKTIQLKTNTISQMFNDLQNELGGKLNKTSQEFKLELNSDLAIGSISGITFKNDITFMKYDVTFKQDTIIKSTTSATNPINFMYCSNGQLSYGFSETSVKKSLNQFQTGIFSSDPNRDSILFFRKDQAVKFTNIKVDALQVSDDESIDLLKNQLIKNFMPKNGEEMYTYVGSYNLKIAEKIQQIDAISQKGIVRNLLINGTVHVILALEIQQHKEDLKNLKNNFGSLTRSEMEDIKEISSFIKNYPEIQYSLKYLSKKSGLSPSKLQEGFKLLHDRTVTDFIRNVRVETAENLIKTTDLNISEIVYTVGLTSRSYFSKIFKEKYDCSPKYYQDNQHRLGVTA